MLGISIGHSAQNPISGSLSVIGAITLISSSEKIGCRASGVPFPEGNGALPAFVHGLLERAKHFGSVLRFVAFEGTFEIFKISGSVGNINGEVGGIGAVKRQ